MRIVRPRCPRRGSGCRPARRCTALGAAAADVREYGYLRPPDALRDTHYYRAKKLGRGKGYIYPHSDPAGFDVDHLPNELKGRRYYEPSGSGEETDD
jgi:putative ATPase